MQLMTWLWTKYVLWLTCRSIQLTKYSNCLRKQRTKRVFFPATLLTGVLCNWFVTLTRHRKIRKGLFLSWIVCLKCLMQIKVVVLILPSLRLVYPFYVEVLPTKKLRPLSACMITMAMVSSLWMRWRDIWLACSKSCTKRSQEPPNAWVFLQRSLLSWQQSTPLSMQIWTMMDVWALTNSLSGTVLRKGRMCKPLTTVHLIGWASRKFVVWRPWKITMWRKCLKILLLQRMKKVC